MSQPFISIIVPIFNAQEHLDECLSSIQAQTLKDWECVCVNDGSTDKSVELVESFIARDSRFRIVSQKNGGPGAARNRGLADVECEWFSFVDADDVIHPELLEHLLSLAKSHKADLAVCGLLQFKQVYDLPESEDVNSLSGQVKVYREFMLPKMVDWRQFRVHPFGKLYHYSLHGDMKFPELYGAEDAYVSLDVYARSTCAVFSSKQFYGYRIVDNSLTHSANRYRNYIVGDAQVVMHCQDVCHEYHVGNTINAQISRPYIMRMFHYVNLMSIDSALSSGEKKTLMNLAYHNLVDVRSRVAGKFRVVPRINVIVYLVLRLKCLRLLIVYQQIKSILARSRLKLK